MFIKADSIPDQHGMSNMTILMIQEFSWKMWCNMDFSSYPIDQQVCYKKVFWSVCVQRTCNAHRFAITKYQKRIFSKSKYWMAVY